MPPSSVPKRRRERRATFGMAKVGAITLNNTSSARRGQMRRWATFYRAPGMKESGGLKRGPWRARLMERLQQGDADACAALLDDIGPLLTRFLRRRIADHQEIEDVYQEVVVAIFQARHTYEPGRPLEPWL